MKKKITTAILTIIMAVAFVVPTFAASKPVGKIYKAGDVVGGKVITSVTRPTDSWGGYALGYIFTFADGSTARYMDLNSLITKCSYNEEYELKYIIPRIDFSDGLLDMDMNGIDDRDPSNFCGYTDLNYNCLADNAPTFVPTCFTEAQTMMKFTCPHGVIEDCYFSCMHPECVAEREKWNRLLVW